MVVALVGGQSRQAPAQDDDVEAGVPAGERGKAVGGPLLLEAEVPGQERAGGGDVLDVEADGGRGDLHNGLLAVGGCLRCTAHDVSAGQDVSWRQTGPAAATTHARRHSPWGSGAMPRHGPGRGLSVPVVIGAAIALADQEGLAAVTMRRVARELGVSAMTICTYVPGKGELLDLMLDALYRQLPRHDTTGQPGPERLTAVADGNRALYLAHPWASAVSTLRPPLGPGLMARYEHELTALEGLGLSDVQMDDSLTYLLSFVQANARAAVDARLAGVDSAMKDEQWWAANAGLVSQVLDEQAFPLAVRMGSAAGAAQGSAHNPEHAYRFGLECLLDGLALLIDRHT